jgi:short-subunit dehydrogenase
MTLLLCDGRFYFWPLGFAHDATYCASKFETQSFSQALILGLVDTNIIVTYIDPCGVKMPMNDAATTAMMEYTSNTMDAPEKVAIIIVDALKREMPQVFIGQLQSFLVLLNGLWPRLVNMGLKNKPCLPNL